MDINFREHAIVDGVTIQRADVTGNARFWSMYRMLPKSDQKKLTIKREIVNGKKKWFVYRTSGPDTVLHHRSCSVPCGYRLSDTSMLYPYQRPAATHICDSLIRNGCAADGSDTGTGKTYVALQCCRELKLRPAIVCRKAGIPGWRRACIYMKVKPLFIVNWEYAKAGHEKLPYVFRTFDRFTGGPVFKWGLPRDTLLIFDEAHAANHRGSINNALYMAARGLPTLSLSATLADRPGRMRPVLEMLGAVDMRKFDAWMKSRGAVLLNDELEGLSDLEDMKQIHAILFPEYGYRISADDPEVRKFFPDGIYNTHMIELTASGQHRQNVLYNNMLKKVSFYREKGKNAEALVADLRYRQAAELLKADALIELTNDYLEEGKSVCIFVNFIETLRYIGAAFNTGSLIFGDQERYHIPREKVIDDFQTNKKRLVVAVVGAGGESIDLHDLDGNHPRISLICPTYNPVQLMQVLGRTRRAGAKSTPVMKLVYAAGTVEEKVAATVNRKLDNIKALNEGDLMEPDLFQMGVNDDRRS